MKILCTILIVLLGAALPLSLWADAMFPCDQQDQPQSRHIMMEESTYADTAAHNGHVSAQQAKSHHNSSSSSDSSAIDCVCCVGCVSVCASSACAVSASDAESSGSVFGKQGQPTAAANRFYSDPNPDSLFRPPNPNAWLSAAQ